MNSNNTSKNIANAFSVVMETYDSVQKLISFLLTQAKEREEYISCSERFLRWKSDQNIYGWAIRSFILVFQSTSDPELDNEWRDGPLYVLEIILQNDDYEEPVVLLARYDYSDLCKWSSGGLSPGNYTTFWEPLHNWGGCMDYTGNDIIYDGVLSDKTKEDKYWGIQRIRGTTIPLVDITPENACEKVFGGFDKLSIIK